MADDGTMERMETTSRDANDREGTVLASPCVQAATVDGETWTGTSKVSLERAARRAVAIVCLFDQGCRCGPGCRHGSGTDPRVSRLPVDRSSLPAARPQGHVL